MSPWQEEYKDCLEYIDSYWNKIIYKTYSMRLPHTMNIFPVKDKIEKYHIIPIPHTYFVPNDKKFKFIFYWDSFFMFRGLLGTHRHWLTKSMVNNFMYLFNKYQIIPNFNAPASMGRSQPPFFSSMIMDSYLTLIKQKSKGNLRRFYSEVYKIGNTQWFKNAIKTAKKEYDIVWIDKEKLYNHSVDGYELSRFGDRDIGYAHSSELESGWDMTSRFYNRCNEYFPIDLNIYLYKYELDFAKAGQILHKKNDETYWLEKSEKRRATINTYMWDDTLGFYFDYNYKDNQKSDFYSLASFTPLWAGLATFEQAKKMQKHLAKFETKCGLTITDKNSLAKAIDFMKIQEQYRPAIEEVIKPKQWDYPNIWSPLEYLTVIGLLRYGFIADAKRIMKNSVNAHASLFRKYQSFFEKINGETGEPSASFHYESQKGFGWTNAVFYRYIQILDALDSSKDIYLTPKPSEPPYELSIIY